MSHKVPFPSIAILGLAEVNRLTAPPFDFVLSIQTPDEPLPRPAWIAPGAYQALVFADIEDPLFADGPILPPSRQDVAAILAFGGRALTAQRAAARRLALLVHCKAGMCRSAAAAYAIYCDWYGPGREVEAAATVLAIRTQAVPNRLVVQYADELLGRQGRVLAAAQVFYNKDPLG